MLMTLRVESLRVGGRRRTPAVNGGRFKASSMPTAPHAWLDAAIRHHKAIRGRLNAA